MLKRNVVIVVVVGVSVAKLPKHQDLDGNEDDLPKLQYEFPWSLSPESSKKYK